MVADDGSKGNKEQSGYRTPRWYFTQECLSASLSSYRLTNPTGSNFCLQGMSDRFAPRRRRVGRLTGTEAGRRG